MLKKKLINLLYTLALYAKDKLLDAEIWALKCTCLLYTSPSPRDCS